MNIEILRQKNWIIFECVSGSHMYGTNIEGSDTDIRGVFIQPTEDVLGTRYISQVSDEKNDVTFYEIGRFIELLREGNPNILDILNAPEDCIIYKHDCFDKYFPDPSVWITSKLKHSFTGYAWSQIKKATGLNKYVNNPMPKERKTPVDFCYIIENEKSRPLSSVMRKEDLARCGVSSCQNGQGLYMVYPDPYGLYNFKGFINEEETSNGLRLSSIPENYGKSSRELWDAIFTKDRPFLIYYNENGYTKHCADYKKYWDWVEKRNKLRYELNTAHADLGYDLKNMSHTVRLLNMASDIADGKGIVCRRPERQHLLDIRNGKYSYDEIMEKAEDFVEQINLKFDAANLPRSVDEEMVHNLLVKIRLDKLKPNEI